MRRPCLVLFCEDIGHELFAQALVKRVAQEVGVPQPRLVPRVARGGHGRALHELELFQKGVRAGVASVAADGVVVMIDGNSAGWREQQRAVRELIDPALFTDVAIGCPDPHVEAWCAADLKALGELTGATLPPLPKKSGRGSYKRWLREALEAGGIPVLHDPMDIAADLVPNMTLYAAGRASPSLGHFVEDLRAMLRRVKAAEARA